ncbi:helix-turn-helix domain-containing protein [Bradyrhizobium sp. AZCC 2289]|uniref:helix-turn-helix domain-containing protein n=1 Tax=Bradyrhizobium sp. AZCC 2289 TaxID=3117026 RepID=UPI002FF3849A
MKITSEGKKKLIADLQRYMQQRDWNISDLAANSGVHQSQISRIVAGDFKTFSSNIIKICITFGLEPQNYYENTREDEDRKQIANSAISIWDGSRQDAGVVVSLLREIAKLRKQDRRR